MKFQQAKTEWGIIREREGERDREQRIKGVRDGVLVRSGKGRVLEMAVSEKGHLSIFSKANQ